MCGLYAMKQNIETGELVERGGLCVLLEVKQDFEESCQRGRGLCM